MYLNLLKQPTIRNGGNNMNSLQFGTEVIWIYHVQSSRESSKHHIKLRIAATIQFQILCIVIWTNLYHLRLCLDTSNLPGQRHGDWAHVTSKSRPPNCWKKWTNITYTSYKKYTVLHWRQRHQSRVLNYWPLLYIPTENWRITAVSNFVLKVVTGNLAVGAAQPQKFRQCDHLEMGQKVS